MQVITKRQDTFENIISYSNLKRIIIIGCVYSFLEVIGLIMSTLGFFKSDIRIYVATVVLFHIIYLPIAIRIYYKKEMYSKKIIGIVEKIYFPVVVIWASIFTILVYIATEDISVYSMVILVCASVFIFEPRFSRRLFSASIIFFTFLIYINTSNILIANALMFKALIVTILAYFISSTNYNIRLKLYKSNTELKLVNDRLKDQVIRDSMTGLYNNSYVFDYINQAVKLEKDLSVIMLDIDDFKKINDEYGHLYGDEVIKSIAYTLSYETRDIDVVGRYGGEEFIIVLNNSDIERARRISMRILESVRNLKFDFNATVTVSIGISQWDKDTGESLIKKADDKLYMAKDKGKNCIC